LKRLFWFALAAACALAAAATARASALAELRRLAAPGAAEIVVPVVSEPKGIRPAGGGEIARILRSGGGAVVGSEFTAEEIVSYREECRQFLERGKCIHTRINSDSIKDYIHPRSHDRETRTYRIYQFLHNHKADRIGRFLGRAIDLRNAIEEAWVGDPTYRAERESLQNYAIVTYYLRDKGMLPKHRDYSGPAPLPLVQFWVALSRPGVDYHKGNLVLYSKNGHRYRVETDLGIRQGDAMIFDKSLFHEVESMEGGDEDSIGRWTVLIGARAKRDPWWKVHYKKLRYGTALSLLGRGRPRQLQATPR